jgi:hypothetical protein
LTAPGGKIVCAASTMRMSQRGVIDEVLMVRHLPMMMA